MQLTLRQGTRQQSIRFLLFDGHELGKVKTGLTSQHAGLTAAYIRDGDLTPTSLTLVPWEKEGFVSCGFREVDAQLMPGLYELGLPDELCQEGARRATLLIRAPGVIDQMIYLDLVAYDPYDRDRLGLDCLSREARHEVIARAFREVVPEIVQEFLRKEREAKQ